MKKEFFTLKKISPDLTTIWSACGEIMYLITGSKRALLVDTNLGVRGLRKTVDQLTDLPLTVVLTHGHVDHAMGAPEFADKEVYLNSADLPDYRSMCDVGGRKDYIRDNLGKDYHAFGFTDDDFLPAEPDFPFLPLEDGTVFDLGSIHVEAVSFPGHTRGSMALYIPELKMLITGDACNPFTFLFGGDSIPLAQYRQNVIAMRDRFEGKLDHICLSHREMEGGTALLSDMVEVCDDVLAGRTDDVPFTFMGQQAYIAKACDQNGHRLDGKTANVVYNKEKIR